MRLPLPVTLPITLPVTLPIWRSERPRDQLHHHWQTVLPQLCKALARGARRALLGSLLSGLAGYAAAAETQAPPQGPTPTPVFRCGNRYSDQPCPGARVIDSDDPRSPQQRQQALRNIRRDEALGNAMEQSRKDQERAASERAAHGAVSPGSDPARASAQGKSRAASAQARRRSTAAVQHRAAGKEAPNRKRPDIAPVVSGAGR